MKKLSIVVPVYNQSAFTAQCLRNLKEACKNIDHEILIIDDGSTDNTQEIVSYFVLTQNMDNIRYYKFKKNVGVTKARNRGVELAEGEYICVINNDVLFLDWHFEKLMNWLTGKTIMTCPRFTEWTKPFATAVTYFKDHICGHCFCFKKSMRKKLFPIDERMRIFGNDNRLYYHLKEQWYNLKLIKDAICHHFGKQTTFAVQNTDRPIYFQIAKERWRKINISITMPKDTPKTDLIF